MSCLWFSRLTCFLSARFDRSRCKHSTSSHLVRVRAYAYHVVVVLRHALHVSILQRGERGGGRAAQYSEKRGKSATYGGVAGLSPNPIRTTSSLQNATSSSRILITKPYQNICCRMPPPYQIHLLSKPCQDRYGTRPLPGQCSPSRAGRSTAPRPEGPRPGHHVM